MKASDFMTEKVITAQPDDTVESVVQTMLEHGVGAVPVVDADNRVLGVVSDGDLLNRPETGTARRRSRWLDLFSGSDVKAERFLKQHGTRARDVMTSPAVTATEDESAAQIAGKLERHRINRVPIVRDGVLVGIVSRGNLLRSFASGSAERGRSDDATTRAAIMDLLDDAGLASHLVSVIVHEGTVELWGVVDTASQVSAARAAAETAAPGATIQNYLSVKDPRARYS